MTEEPVFKMVDKSRYIHIYTSGRVETNMDLPNIIINKIPQLRHLAK